MDFLKRKNIYMKYLYKYKRKNIYIKYLYKYCYGNLSFHD